MGRTFTALGELASSEWQRTAVVRPDVTLDDFVVMPNHLHALVHVPEALSRNSGGIAGRPIRSVASLVGGYNGYVTRQARLMSGNKDLRVWQSRYHEHVVRSAAALERLRTYVRENPRRWNEDRYFV